MLNSEFEKAEVNVCSVCTCIVNTYGGNSLYLKSAWAKVALKCKHKKIG